MVQLGVQAVFQRDYPILLATILFSAVLITGERSNGFKVTFGLILFFILNKRLNFNYKIFTLLSVITIFLFAIEKISVSVLDDTISPIVKRWNACSQL